MATMEKIENNKIKLTFAVTKDAFNDAVNESYRKNCGKYSVPGFRKGKAPRRIIEQHYGPSIFYDDAFDIVFSPAYAEAADELHITPVDRPSVDIKEFTDDEVVFEAEVFVKPEVNLGKYTGIKIDKIAYTVSDADIDEEIKHAQDRASRWVNADDRPVADGDMVNLDYSGSVNGVKFDGGTAADQSLIIGSKRFIPGFEEALIGMDAGEERDIAVTFPSDYHQAELAGAEAVFAVKINEIKSKEVPALDDEFAKDVSEFDTLEEYRGDIAKRLNEQKAKQGETETENALIDAVVAETEIDIPECMIDSEIDYMMRELEYRLRYQGIKLSDYLAYTGRNAGEIREQYRPDAAKRIKLQLVMEAVGKAENLDPTEEDIEAELTKRAEAAEKTVEEIRERIGDGEMSYIKNSLKSQKILDFIKENNITE